MDIYKHRNIQLTRVDIIRYTINKVTLHVYMVRRNTDDLNKGIESREDMTFLNFGLSPNFRKLSM